MLIDWWYSELAEMLFHNISILITSLIICTIISCKYQRKPKSLKFIDENDPQADTLYNIKTEIAFPKRISDEKQSSFKKDANIAMSWSREYESNMPQSLSLSSPKTVLNSTKYFKLASCDDTQTPSSPDRLNRMQTSPNSAIILRI
ncbi:unnamed protein product [Onchocerca flexuosa]|uniref:Uncharacterized protein n=1 Tax=Onchocerca flexuosa TaxID=387005 RepID=A0A183HE56_9BILA|nr:unnamed protein product [Onchocerca flexuosa]